jgi:urocanate hydratase
MSIDRTAAPRDRVLAMRGTGLRAKSWRSEALLRMLENVLEVGERPQDLIVYASLGKAARDWDSYHRIVEALLALREDETLVLQSGMPIGVIPTHADAPMVVSAVNNTVGNWSDSERFYARARANQTIWGGLTAGAWQYIGRQGVLQGTYELLRAVALRHFGTAAEDELDGRWLLTAGLGGMGSAQPISAKLVGLSSLTVEVDPQKISRMTDAGGLDYVARDIADALRRIAQAKSSHTPVAIGMLGNAATVFDEVLHRRVVPDIVSDQTAAHDPRYGYVPEGYELRQWIRQREVDPERVENDARRSMARQVRSMLAFGDLGAVVFENGNNLRAQARLGGVPDAFVLPGFMEGYLRPLFARGIGPFRWVALSGDEADLAVLDDMAASLFPERPEVAEWIAKARNSIPTQGLPARSCWLGHGERSRMAVAVNEAVADGRLTAPVLFTRDHLDSAGMTHPRIGTEGMKDNSDGVTDWPLLDAMLLAATGGDLVAVHSGGGGYSGWMQSAGVSVWRGPAAADGAGYGYRPRCHALCHSRLSRGSSGNRCDVGQRRGTAELVRHDQQTCNG